MTIEQICVSLELAKELKEAGYPQDGLFWWSKRTLTTARELEKWKLLNRKTGFELLSAPTASELGEQLPSEINIPFKNGKPRAKNNSLKSYFGKGARCINCIYTKVGEEGIWINGDTEADARAKMWLYLKQNNLLTK